MKKLPVVINDVYFVAVKEGDFNGKKFYQIVLTESISDADDFMTLSCTGDVYRECKQNAKLFTVICAEGTFAEVQYGHNPVKRQIRIDRVEFL